MKKIMTPQTTQIPVSLIILDETIYPRKGIDHRRVGMFAENIRDGIAKQMGINQASIHNHLLKMATLPNLINADLVRGPCRPSASARSWFLPCRKKAYWALPAGM
jgi:hypothetical protein